MYDEALPKNKNIRLTLYLNISFLSEKYPAILF